MKSPFQQPASLSSSKTSRLAQFTALFSTPRLASLLGALSLLFLNTAGATENTSAQLRPHTAVYTVTGKQGSASTTRTLAVDQEGVWTLEQAVKLLIFRINEGSQFTVDNGQIVPIKFHHTRNIGRSKNQAVFFNWAAMSAANNNDKDNWKAELEPGILDRMSLPLQIQLDLINGTLAGKKDYKLLDKGKIKTYTVEVVGFETLQTVFGNRQLLKLSQSRKGSDKEILSWLDPSQDYLMMHSQQIEDDEVITLEIESIQYSDKNTEKAASASPKE